RGPADAPRVVRLAGGRGGGDGRLLQCIVAGAPRSNDSRVVRCDRRSGRARHSDAARARAGDPWGRPRDGEVCVATGLARDTCVVVGCGDEMAATLGAGVYAPGDVCDVVGTAEPVCAVSSTPREDRTMLVECHPHGDPDSWLLENPGFVSGGNLRWWRDHFFGPDSEYDAICAPAADVAPGAEGLVFLPCIQGAMAPAWNGAARGVLCG